MQLHARLLLQELRNQTLSEARSGMSMQELKTESADMSLRELNRQIHSHRMEPHHANQTYEMERASLAPNSTRKITSRNSYWNFPGKGELEKTCCTEVERMQQLSVDDCPTRITGKSVDSHSDHVSNSVLSRQSVLSERFQRRP